MSEYLKPEDFFREQPREPEKVIDEEYQFKGYWDREPEGVCRVRYFLRDNCQAPVMLVSELPENRSTSITNAAEYLYPQLIRDICPERFEHLEPVELIEHYGELKDHRGKVIREESYDRVMFASWTPKMIFLGGQQRLSFGEPTWQRLKPEEVTALIGDAEQQDSKEL